jgi:pimeloyl-ACP methyl ester carboxylesterase
MKRARLVPEDAVPLLEPLPGLWPGREVAIDGASTFAREIEARGPDAEPALFVHGLGGSSSNWTDLGELLADRLAGQAIDLPGFGRSEPAAMYTVSAMAQRVARWIEVADRGPVHLFGNSMGGAVVVRLAANRPDLVRTLTLISPAMPFLDPRRSVQGRLVPLLFLPQAQRLASRRLAGIDPAELARMIITSCFADPTRFPEERLEQAVHTALVRRRVHSQSPRADQQLCAGVPAGGRLLVAGGPSDHRPDAGDRRSAGPVGRHPRRAPGRTGHPGQSADDAGRSRSRRPDGSASDCRAGRSRAARRVRRGAARRSGGKGVPPDGGDHATRVCRGPPSDRARWVSGCRTARPSAALLRPAVRTGRTVGRRGTVVPRRGNPIAGGLGVVGSTGAG